MLREMLSLKLDVLIGKLCTKFLCYVKTFTASKLRFCGVVREN